MKKLTLLILMIPLISFGQTEKEYYDSGNLKANQNDFEGAIEDYTKAIELNPDYDYFYTNRGVSKENLGDLKGACADWKEAARLGDKYYAAKWVRNQCN